MSDNVTFREAPPPVVEQPKVDLPDPEPNRTQSASALDENEPIELSEANGQSLVLNALDINDDINNLTSDDKADLGEVKQYVIDVIKAKGLPETVASFKKSLNSLKSEMGLDQEADPAVVIERIAGVVKAWRNLTFIKDPTEKRSLFMKLANMKSVQDMNREVFKAMENYKVWI